MDHKEQLSDQTLLCHDRDTQRHHGAVVTPIYQNTLFAFEDWDAIDGAFEDIRNRYVYSRLLNPTVVEAEHKIALLSRGEAAKLCASGMAAISAAIMHCVSAGDHIITIKSLYGPANSFIGTYLKDKCGISISYVSGTDISDIESAITPKTKLIYLESPSSMLFLLQDLESIASLAKDKGIKTVIDNTWASPIYQKPLELGIDIEVHSVSKYLCGHSDVVAGVIISSKDILDEILMKEHALLGGKMSPFEAWLILRSMRTLSLRMAQHQDSTLIVARYLADHKAVRKVHYPGLESHPQYDLGKKQMTGYSGLLSMELDIEEIEDVKRFVDGLGLFKIGVSWGGHESLIYAPVISYTRELTKEQYEAFGIPTGLVRLSIGLENINDLILDLDNALSLMY